MMSLSTKLLATSAVSLLLISCGSSDTDTGPITWQSGVFQNDSTFKNMCQTPRSGQDINGVTFPDQAGSTLEENHWLRSWSNDTYLWYDEIQDQNPANFSNTLSYFEVLKTNAMTVSGNQKDNFHFSQDTASYQQQVSSGASSGYGARFRLIQSAPPRKILIAYTEANSPATNAGLSRGAEIIEIDGVDAINGGTQADVNILNAGLFPATDGETHSFVVRDLGSSTTRTLSMTSATISADPVQNEKIINTASGKVGYMQFNTFGTLIAENELIDAMTTFANEPIQDLVVDLRYNGGGFLFISSQLAYMVAGSTQTAGRTFETIVFNDKYPTTNPVTGDVLSPTPFFNTSTTNVTLPSLNLNRVFVLSTSSTCSASEAFINALRGINVEVILIGGTTCGKPYGFYPTDNCGTTYFTIQFAGENDKEFSEYSDGFVPSANDNGQDVVKGCVVDDDFDNLLGDENEDLLAAALNYRTTGNCPTINKIATPNIANGQHEPGSLLNSDYLKNRLLLEQNRILGMPQVNQ